MQQKAPHRTYLYQHGAFPHVLLFDLSIVSAPPLAINLKTGCFFNRKLIQLRLKDHPERMLLLFLLLPAFFTLRHVPDLCNSTYRHDALVSVFVFCDVHLPSMSLSNSFLIIFIGTFAKYFIVF